MEDGHIRQRAWGHQRYEDGVRRATCREGGRGRPATRSNRHECDGVRGASGLEGDTAGTVRGAFCDAMVASDRLQTGISDVGVLHPEARGVGVCDQRGGLAASCGPPGAQRIDSGESLMGSGELMRCFKRDAAGATSSSVSEFRRLTEGLLAQNQEFSLYSSPDSVATTTFDLEPNWSESHLVGCWRATKDGGTVKSYQPEELDWSTDSTLAA